MWLAMLIAGASYMQVATDEQLLRDKQFDLLRVKVVDVSKDATNGEPPVVTLDVLQALRGDEKRTRLQARWSPEPDRAATAETGAGPADHEALARWLAAPCAGPALGAAFIVLVERFPDGSATVLHRCRFPDTPEELRRVTRLLGKK